MTTGGLVAILFTDLVDSTAIASALGPDAADRLRRTHFESLRHAVGAHTGTEVKNTGDGLMVAFVRPSDAAACAVAMQQATHHVNRGADHDVAMARTALELAVTLRQRGRNGDVERAADLFDRAEGVAAEVGMPVLLAEIARHR
jgi:class 3 adenylate cyclase